MRHEQHAVRPANLVSGRSISGRQHAGAQALVEDRLYHPHTRLRHADGLWGPLCASAVGHTGPDLWCSQRTLSISPPASHRRSLQQPGGTPWCVTHWHQKTNPNLPTMTEFCIATPRRATRKNPHHESTPHTNGCHGLHRADF